MRRLERKEAVLGDWGKMSDDHPLEDVDITPAMRQAGFDTLCLYDAECGDAEETAMKVYRAMEGARQAGASTS